MSPRPPTQVEDFAERAARLARRPDSAPSALRAPSPRGTPLHRHPAATSFGFFLGLIGVIAGQVLRFRMGGQPTTPETADFDLLMGLAYGFGLTFVVTLALGMTTLRQIAMQGAGVIVMSCLFHNIYHWFPMQAALAFSPRHVLEMQAATTPNTLRLPEMAPLAFGPAAAPGADPSPAELATAALALMGGEASATPEQRQIAETMAAAILSGNLAGLEAGAGRAAQNPQALDMALLGALSARHAAARNEAKASIGCTTASGATRGFAKPARLVMQSDRRQKGFSMKLREWQLSQKTAETAKSLAGAAGLEPATLGFGDRCSNN
ncbi:MAG: hypothetical protein JNN06_05930 [Gemmobacter sp.]|uniref:hypothetical protein n=1 Tax=Gemmobacter sp. TaxID=1898957 RepID=UPI001A517F40|nr:hypothetical protein [Gemmobacter sp.]MBL8561801.1 hypothetical protein [Gemmobacter sp.]